MIDFTKPNDVTNPQLGNSPTPIKDESVIIPNQENDGDDGLVSKKPTMVNMAIPNDDRIIQINFEKRAERDNNSYNGTFNPANKFPAFTVKDPAPVVFDAGYAFIGNVFDKTWDVTQFGFSHITQRSFINTLWATRFRNLVAANKAAELNADAHIFDTNQNVKLKFFHDTTSGLPLGDIRATGNPFGADFNVIQKNLDTFFLGEAEKDWLNVSLISFDYELNEIVLPMNKALERRNFWDAGKYRHSSSGGTDPTWKTINDALFYQKYSQTAVDFWTTFIKMLRDKIRLKTPFVKTSWYGVGSQNGCIYSQRPETDYLSGACFEWGTAGNSGLTIGNMLDYQNGQVYCGEPLSITDSNTLIEMLAAYESARFAESKPSILHIKPFRENITGQATGNCTNCMHASASKQIAMGMALIPFFTGNGSWLWGTEGRKELGNAIENFINGRMLCSFFNDLMDGNQRYVVPEVRLVGEPNFIGDANNWKNAISPANATRYNAWTISKRINATGRAFPLVRVIRNGNQMGLIATRIGGSDDGRSDIEIKMTTMGGSTWQKTITLQGRDWYVGKVGNMGNPIVL
jgi:hypothetical protein